MLHGPDAIDIIKRYEGFRASPYLCPAGIWTIGYGSTRDRKGMPITPISSSVSVEEALVLLQKEVEKCDNTIARLISVPLVQGQWDALVDFVYNMGSGRLQSSTLRQIINREEHEDVPGELRKWVWSGGRRLPGLVRRREDEACLYSS